MLKTGCSANTGQLCDTLRLDCTICISAVICLAPGGKGPLPRRYQSRRAPGMIPPQATVSSRTVFVSRRLARQVLQTRECGPEKRFQQMTSAECLRAAYICESSGRHWLGDLLAFSRQRKAVVLEVHITTVRWRMRPPTGDWAGLTER